MKQQPELIERLLEAERQRVELSSDQVDSLWRESASLAAAVATPAGSVISAGLLKTLGIVIVAFGGGVMVGRGTATDQASESLVRGAPQAALVVAQWQRPKDAPREVSEPSEVPPANPSRSASPAGRSGPSSSSPVVSASDKPSAPPTSGQVKPRSSLQEERVLVEGARTALLRARPADALRLARKHKTQFPAGQMAEDRDFIIATALSKLGRKGEAQASAESFHATLPKERTSELGRADNGEVASAVRASFDAGTLAESA